MTKKEQQVHQLFQSSNHLLTTNKGHLQQKTSSLSLRQYNPSVFKTDRTAEIHFSFEGEDYFLLQAALTASKQDHVSRYCSFLSQTPREQQVPAGINTHYARGLSIEPYVFNFTEDASVIHN